jgi:hypothetical protein
VKWPFLTLAAFGALATLPLLPKGKSLDIGGYKKWAPANEQPVKMSAAVSALCIAPNTRQLMSTDPRSPHKDYFLKVYVNAIGAAQFLKDATPDLPVGTIVVKEKLASQTSKSPELCTVMRKREPGYDSAGGNWEYAVFDKNGRNVEDGALPRCISCHQGQKATDYVYRSYVSLR